MRGLGQLTGDRGGGADDSGALGGGGIGCYSTTWEPSADMDVAADGSSLGPTNTTAPANRFGVSNGAAAGVVVAGVTVPGAGGSCASGAFARSSGHVHYQELACVGAGVAGGCAAAGSDRT
jgi:hypothetical protein